jgi:hypothetical protein
MDSYREIVPCKVCQTQVYIAATRRNGRSAKANGIAVVCPICGSILSIPMSSAIDTATVLIVGFASGSVAPKPAKAS